MKLLIAGLLAASTVIAAAPAVAQGVYVGPNGVGFGFGGHRHDRGDYRDRDGYFGHRRMNEGRSAYDGRRGDFRGRY